MLLVVLLSLTAGSASAGSGCAQQVIQDWSDNGTIDGSYPTACYQQAIAALPEDLRSYSSAADDISRALQATLLGGVAENGGGVDENGGGGVTESTDAGASSGQNGGTGSGESSADAGGAAGEEAPPTEGSAPLPNDEAVAPVPSEAAAPLETDGDGAGLPVPVIVLLAVAGVAAVAGLVFAGRRMVRDRTGADA